MAATTDNPMGAYLRDRRTRLDPAALGFPAGRRRTPGLRREEVAQRAHISPTWYTWLEQGRGGAPSADVLDRIAAALMLTAPEREHLFMLGLGRPPEIHYTPVDAVSPRLQRVVDAFEIAPVIVKTATWDVVAWNRAATVLLTDYSKLSFRERNILRLIFADSGVRARQDNWWAVARFVVAAFRADATRAGASAESSGLVEELSKTSAEFNQLWQEHDVAAPGEGSKRLHHDALGLLDFDFSAFAVEGRPELGMVVYNPANEETASRIRAYLATT